MFHFQPQITSHLDNLGPAPQIQRLDGVLPIQETGQVINQRFTQSSEYDIGLEVNEPVQTIFYLFCHFVFAIVVALTEK